MPGFGVVLRRLVVQSEDLRLLFRVTARKPLDRGSCFAVQLPPPAKGQTFVHDVAHDRLPEAPSPTIVLEEASKLSS